MLSAKYTLSVRLYIGSSLLNIFIFRKAVI